CFQQATDGVCCRGRQAAGSEAREFGRVKGVRSDGDITCAEIEIMVIFSQASLPLAELDAEVDFC
ncbi:MAG: hypothetical protein AAFQ61_08815, partial [Cyanobacteria bacterium J06626_23]